MIEVSSRKVFSGSWVFGFEYFHIGKCFVVDLHVLLVSLGICLYIYILVMLIVLFGARNVQFCCYLLWKSIQDFYAFDVPDRFFFFFHPFL